MDWGLGRDRERNFKSRWTECNREEIEKQDGWMDGMKEGRKGKKEKKRVN